MESLTTENILTFAAFILIAIPGIRWLALKWMESQEKRLEEHKSALKARDETIKTEREYNREITERFHSLHARTVEVVPEFTKAVERNTGAIEKITETVQKCEGQ